MAWEFDPEMAGNSGKSENRFVADKGAVVLAQAIGSASDDKSAAETESEGVNNQKTPEQNQTAPTLPTPIQTESTPEKTSPQSLVEARNKTLLAMSRLLDSGFYVGYEANYIWALNSGSLELSLSQPGQPQGMSFSSKKSLGPGGRVWIGMRAAERGVRASYSFFNGQRQGALDAPALNTTIARAIAQHELQTFDIELTQPFRLGRTDLELTAGARHLRFQSLNSLFIEAEPTKSFQAIGTAATSNELNALGFTGSIHGRRPLPGSILNAFATLKHRRVRLQFQ